MTDSDRNGSVVYRVVLLPDQIPYKEDESVIGEFSTREKAEERKRDRLHTSDLLGSDYEIREVQTNDD